MGQIYVRRNARINESSVGISAGWLSLLAQWLKLEWTEARSTLCCSSSEYLSSFCVTWRTCKWWQEFCFCGHLALCGFSATVIYWWEMNSDWQRSTFIHSVLPWAHSPLLPMPLLKITVWLIIKLVYALYEDESFLMSVFFHRWVNHLWRCISATRSLFPPEYWTGFCWFASSLFNIQQNVQK